MVFPRVSGSARMEDALFVADYGKRTVLKFKGSPASGFSADPTFTVHDACRGHDFHHPSSCAYGIELSRRQQYPRCRMPRSAWRRHGLPLWADLHAEPHQWFFHIIRHAGLPHRCSRMEFRKDRCDTTLREGGTVGDVSGYTSCYDVKWDSNKHLYIQSYYGWTVDKWAFQGTLPTIAVTDVDEIGSSLPSGYALSQTTPTPSTRQQQLNSPCRSQALCRCGVRPPRPGDCDAGQRREGRGKLSRNV